MRPQSLQMNTSLSEVHLELACIDKASFAFANVCIKHPLERPLY